MVGRLLPFYIFSYSETDLHECTDGAVLDVTEEGVPFALLVYACSSDMFCIRRMA